MKVIAINNNKNRTQFCSKVIIAPNTASRLHLFNEINPIAGKNILKDFKALENNGCNDTVIIESGYSDPSCFVLMVYRKFKNKCLRSANAYPIDISLYNFETNIEQIYNKAKSCMVNIKSIKQSGFEKFNPLN